MKLGTETGSLINHLYSRGTRGQPDPVVGMGATVLHWTDRSPATIVRVFKLGADTAIEIQGDDYKRTDKNGMSECQTYAYSPNPNAARATWRFRAGRWEHVRLNPETRRWKTIKGDGLRIGEREAYHDFSF